MPQNEAAQDIQRSVTTSQGPGPLSHLKEPDLHGQCEELTPEELKQREMKTHMQARS